MPFNLSTLAPLSFDVWQKTYPKFTENDARLGYQSYLRAWYQNNSTIQTSLSADLKQQYIQLLQELSYLFSPEEKDLFLTDINWANNTDVVLAIPLYAQKLKEISQVLVNKRESIKQTKLKYNILGSKQGLETLLYQYILDGFTQRDHNLTQIPYSPYRNQLPPLSSFDNSFRIEVEELYDTNSYLDSDPTVPLSGIPAFPFEDLTEEQLSQLLGFQLFQRATNSPLSLVYQSLLPTLSSLKVQTNFNNQVALNQKYLGATIYSASSQILSSTPNYILTQPLTVGNNWFLWPKGTEDIQPEQFNNVYFPIPLSASNFIDSGATGGSDLSTSDLIFTEKNGKIQGAWLSQNFLTQISGSMQVQLPSQQVREFRFPYPGFNLTSTGSNWAGHNLIDHQSSVFDLLNPITQTQLLETYWTTNLPNSGMASLFINETSLVETGAYAASTSLSADVIIARNSIDPLSGSYQDAASATTHAFLYKFQYTDLGLSAGNNFLLWPLNTFDIQDTFPLAPTSAWCNPIALRDLWTPVNMTGAIAGTTFIAADQIYKLDALTQLPTEAAWLYGGSITQLRSDPTLNINVYNTSAVQCAQWIDGPIQPSLALEVAAGTIQSFIWMDQDTPANEVFVYVEHKSDCPYLLSAPHNYYKRQGVQNLLNPSNTQDWTLCDCKGLQYSPIGHADDSLLAFNGVADYLFADPQGLGSNFAINTWQDTRGLKPTQSPQFSFFQLTSGLDQQIGWGPGSWQTGDGSPMILKNGCRYSYYRSSLRRDQNTQTVPYYVNFYAYNNILVDCPSAGMDIVVLLDFSSSEANNIPVIKALASELIKALLPAGQTSTQVSLMVFDTTVRPVFGFIRRADYVDLLLNNVGNNVPTRTDYILPCQTAIQTLYATSSSSLSSANLCYNANLLINDLAGLTNSQVARDGVYKKIIIIGDGSDNINTTSAILSAWKNIPSEVEVYALDFGPESGDNSIMESIASPFSNYFNIQQILLNGATSIATYSQYLYQFISSCANGFPVWKKAIRNGADWVGTMDNSDLIFQPGDHLEYIHANEINYTTNQNGIGNFTQQATNFKIKAKLNGWDYNSASFNSNNVGIEYGARPFWGTAYNSPSAQENFYKESAYFGGHVRFFNDYIPISQPEISNLLLTNNTWVQYLRRGNTTLTWNQSGLFQVNQSNLGWLKIDLNTELSHLSSLYLYQPLDKIAIPTTQPSDIILEGYHQYQPARYNYWATSAFNYTENLYNIQSCQSQILVTTAVYIEPTSPWANLENIHYPSIAAVSQTTNLKSKTELGYFIPPNIGYSSYYGRGYTINLNVSALSGWIGEPLYWDLNKYGSRNRGLTQKDQLAPVSIKQIDTSWIMAPNTTGLLAGTIQNARDFQKMVPYQSDMEINHFSSFGISRPEDYNVFWTTFNPPTTANFQQAILPLLANQGTMTSWAQDWFGNEYGVFKKV